jgi:hypothetical protein
MKNALWFVAGCVVAFIVTYAVLKPKMNNAADQSTITQLRSQLASDQGTMSQLRAQQADLTQQRDTCTAKFNRATILYDVGILNIESRAWVIPADVEPVVVGNKNGTYAHYDPKTQTETMHFKGKPAK